MSRDWHCDFRSNEEAQWEAIANATPKQRIAWLEEALEIALSAGALDPWTGLRMSKEKQPDRADQ